jgi:uncharacterized membrane protein YphA (DoxX/SURF4 family)
MTIKLSMKRSTIVEIISALFILLFVYTGIKKIQAFDDLKFVLKDYPLIGGLGNTIAWALPTIELLVALLLFIPRFRKIGIYSSLVLMTGFTLYSISLITFAPHLPCTCGGMLQQLSWTQHLIFNIAFILLAIIAIRLQHKNTKINLQASAKSRIAYT